MAQLNFAGDIANSEVQQSKPQLLTFGDGLKNDKIAPQPAFINSEIIITGLGFSKVPNENEVYFIDKFNNRIPARIVKLTENQLNVLVPDSAVSGNIYITVNNIEVSSGIIIISTEMIFIFGDNGNQADDSFQVLLNNVTVDQSAAGQSKRTKTLTLQPGEVDFELVGITVPDSRATYYVCFSNNVDVISGITSAKVDFEPGSQFSTRLRLNVKSESASTPINCKYFDPTTSQPIVMWEE